MLRASWILAIVVFWGQTSYADTLPDPRVISGPLDLRDGDSGYVGDTAIRLWGIDAPELDTPEGRAALACANEFNGLPVICFRKQRALTHQRIVVRCVSPTEGDIAARIVASGHARDWPKFSQGHYTNMKQSYPRALNTCMVK